MLKLNNGIRAKWQPGHRGRPTASPYACVCVCADSNASCLEYGNRSHSSQVLLLLSGFYSHHYSKGKGYVVFVGNKVTDRRKQFRPYKVDVFLIRIRSHQNLVKYDL